MLFRSLLIGGAAKNRAVQEIAASMFASEIVIPQPGEYVADGAAKQAAWALLGSPSAPEWTIGKSSHVAVEEDQQSQEALASYLELIAAI